MKPIAFLGTGLMGAPMVARVIRAGYPVTVWNRTASKAGSLVSLGATLASSPAEAADGCDIAITMLAGPSALEQVASGAGGFGQALRPGAFYLDMSTVGPDCFLSVSSKLSGIRCLDAPVLGSVPQATDGTLDIFVGGDEADFAVVRPVLETMGRPVHVGSPGAGAALKLVLNTALVSLQCVLGECLSLSDAFGLAQRTTLDALAKSSLAPVVEKKRVNIESGDFSPRFTVANAVKDAHLIDGAARARAVKLSLLAAARDWFDAALASGLGDKDYSAVVTSVRG